MGSVFLPCNPIPLDLGGESSPPKSRVWPSNNTIKQRSRTLRPLNLGGESAPLKSRGYGFPGFFCCRHNKERLGKRSAKLLEDSRTSPVLLSLMLSQMPSKTSQNTNDCPHLANPYAHLVNLTLAGLRFHTLQTRTFSSSLALSHTCTRPFLARSSPSPRPALARSNLALFFSTLSIFRVVETVVLENGRFVPCRKQVILTKIGENSDIAFCPQKQGILLLEPRKSTKMTKMAGVTPTK